MSRSESAQIVFFNSLHGFGREIPAEYTVVNAPHPIPGRIVWQGDFRHGIFYAAGPLTEYKAAWESLDAWECRLISNEEIEEFFGQKAKTLGIKLENVLKVKTMAQLAACYGYPYEEPR